MIKPGIYQHYKGGMYEVISEATHSETDEELVIYKSVETGAIFARPKKMFFEKIVHGACIFVRFKFIKKVNISHKEKLSPYIEALLRNFNYRTANSAVNNIEITKEKVTDKVIDLIQALTNIFGNTGFIDGEIGIIVKNALENIGVDFDE